MDNALVEELVSRRHEKKAAHENVLAAAISGAASPMIDRLLAELDVVSARWSETFGRASRTERHEAILQESNSDDAESATLDGAQQAGHKALTLWARYKEAHAREVAADQRRDAEQNLETWDSLTEESDRWWGLANVFCNAANDAKGECEYLISMACVEMINDENESAESRCWREHVRKQYSPGVFDVVLTKATDSEYEPDGEYADTALVVFAGLMLEDAPHVRKKVAHVRSQTLLRGISLDDAIRVKEQLQEAGMVAQIREDEVP